MSLRRTTPGIETESMTQAFVDSLLTYITIDAHVDEARTRNKVNLSSFNTAGVVAGCQLKAS